MTLGRELTFDPVSRRYVILRGDAVKNMYKYDDFGLLIRPCDTVDERET